MEQTYRQSQLQIKDQRTQRIIALEAAMVTAGLPYSSVEQLIAAYSDGLVHQAAYLGSYLSFSGDAQVKVVPVLQVSLLLFESLCFTMVVLLSRSFPS